MINLQKFCEIAGIRAWLAQPFGLGEFTYATNGHLLVRVPRAEWPAPDLPTTAWSTHFQETLDLMNHEPVMAPIPAIPPGPYYRKCTECSETGDVGGVCQECDGEGETECDCCGHTKECEECEGTGRRQGNNAVCDCCDGEGVIEKITYYGFGSRIFDASYLRMIKALPDSRLAIEGSYPMGAVFTFTGGRGVVMPCREDGKVLDLTPKP